MTARCPECGANLALVGKAHRCTPRQTIARALLTCVTNVTNSRNGDRVRKWRQSNPDHYRTYQRDYMRQRRAAAKTTTR